MLYLVIFPFSICIAIGVIFNFEHIFFRLIFQRMSGLGCPCPLEIGNLPTEHSVYSHYLYLRALKQETGEWKQNTSILEAARAVMSDVASQWDKTGIPHTLLGRPGEKKVELRLKNFQKEFKVPLERRDQGFEAKLSCLFDVAACKHIDFSSCTCCLDQQVHSYLDCDADRGLYLSQIKRFVCLLANFQNISISVVNDE